MAIGDDFEIQNDRDIRYTGSGTNYTVLAFHNWLRSLRGAASESGDDFMSIVRRTPSSKAFDKSITLVNNYNIDDYTARFLYDGSITQGSGGTEERFDPLTIFAPAAFRLELVQNEDYVFPNYWGTSRNPDSTKGITHRFLVKVRTAGADIDGRRLLGQTREWGSSFLEFFINGTEVGANAMAFKTSSDLNNAKAEATVAGYTNITNTEGYRLIDVDNDGVTENYYSEWNRDTQTINDLYERMKWLSRRATSEDSNADTGSDFTFGNGTINAQGQSLSQGATPAYLTRCFFNLKKTGAPTGTVVAKVYAHTGTFGSTGTPTGAALATSEAINIVSEITTSYQTFEFLFKTPQLLSASTNYFITVEYTGGDGSNYLQVQGLATTGTHAGNRAENTGTWAAAANDDLNFDAWTSPQLYGMPGEYFRGITHQVAVDNEVGGPFTQPERLTWAGGTGQLLAVVKATNAAVQINVDEPTGKFTRASGNFLTDGFRPGMVFRTSAFTAGGNNSIWTVSTVTATEIVVVDKTGMVTETGTGDEVCLGQMLWIQLLSGAAPTDGQTITGATSSATADTDTSIIERSIPNVFGGTSTGSAIIGAYGVGVESADLSANDQLFSLQDPGTAITPPNNVTGTVSNLVASDDGVLVAPAGLRFRYDNEGGTPPFQVGETLTFTAPAGTARLAEVLDLGTYGELVIGPMLSGDPPVNNSTIAGGTSGATGDVEGTPVDDIDTRQFSLNGALTGGAVTSVVVNEAIPGDQPGSGTIRIQRDDGQYTKHAYSAVDTATKTFTITSHDFSTNNASNGNNVFTAYIDKTAAATSENFTTVYSADRTLFVRVASLSGAATPIKPFESTMVLGSGGGSSNAVRTED